MGNQISAIDPTHVRIYSNLIQIQDPMKRVQMIQTCFTSMEYINSAKRAGVYSYLLHYVSTVQTGGTPSLLPGEQQPIPSSQPSIPRSMQSNFTHSSGIGATHPSMIDAPMHQPIFNLTNLVFHPISIPKNNK